MVRAIASACVLIVTGMNLTAAEREGWDGQEDSRDRELSAHDPTLANRWLNYHRGEYRSWKIGDDIRNRREQARHAGTLAQVEPQLRELEAVLRRLLVELFEQKQAIQQNEGRQLKAELVEMATII